MKKFVKLLSVLLAISLLTAFVVGCSVKGNTYKFESVKVANASGTQVETDEFYESLAQKSITFNKDGTYSVGGTAFGVYQKNGSKIYYSVASKVDTKEDPYFTVKGDTITRTETYENGDEVTYTYKKA